MPHIGSWDLPRMCSPLYAWIEANRESTNDQKWQAYPRQAWGSNSETTYRKHAEEGHPGVFLFEFLYALCHSLGLCPLGPGTIFRLDIVERVHGRVAYIPVKALPSGVDESQEA